MEAIKFLLDQENRPLKEDLSLTSLEISPFKEQYKKSLIEIEEYLNTLTQASIEKDLDYADNIFAFSGDRGSGKTSCMISVGGFLTKPKVLRAEFKNLYPKISDINFYSLDLMDPSYFDSKNNILSLFLAKLYGSFQRLTKHNDDIKENKKIEFLSSLSRAQKHAQILLGKENDTLISNKVEELECLSAAVELKEDIKQLVDNFLECLNSHYDILLLRIDDIDLNAKEAGVMSELIRKYFILPNIVVLMALKLDQLKTIKQNEYASTFDLPKDNEQVVEMSERYLTKLFPHSQRIYMPDIEDLLNRKLILISKTKTVEYPSVQQCVPELIFQKTRYLFYNSSVHASFIVPRNLRDLRQIIKLLWNMEDYKEAIDEKFNLHKNGKYNQAIFKKYLSEVWINNNLSSDHKDFARQILYEEELLRLNYYVLEELRNLPEGAYYYDNELFHICTNENNSAYNLSLGDALGIIEYLYKKQHEDEYHKFLFFIKTVYSIRLYEAYNKLSEPEKIPPIIRDMKLQNNVETKEVLRFSQYWNIEDYDKLVSGYIINVQLQNLLPRGMGLDKRFLGRNEFLDLMNTCASEFESAEEKNFVRLLEFFMLSVSHSKSYETEYRKLDFIVYDEPLDLVEDLTFDLGAFFFNISRIERCYDRFRGYVKLSNGTDLIDKILLSPHTLFNDFKKLAKEKYLCQYDCPYMAANSSDKESCTYYYSRWLSLCTIRNVEILQDFIKFVQNLKIDRIKPDREKLALFFDKCSEYKIQTYDLDSEAIEKKYHTIQFGFTSKIANLLHDVNLDERFMSIFGEDPQFDKSEIEAHY